MKNVLTIILSFFFTSFLTAQSLEHTICVDNSGSQLKLEKSMQMENDIVINEDSTSIGAISGPYVKVRSEKKDKKHAALMSLLWPGLGQFYNGGSTEIIKGTLMAVGQAALLVVLVDALNNDDKYGEVQEYRSYLIGGLMVGNIVYSMLDAGRIAEEMNRTNRVSLNKENLSKFAWRDAYTIISFRIRL